MTITTRSRKLPEPHARASGFTLVEVMIAAALSTIVLAALLATFLFLGRSGANLVNYNDMEAQARKSLELFAEDTRQASSVKWNSGTSLTLTVNAVEITYTCVSGNLTRAVTTFTTPPTTTVTTLLTGITVFNLLAYDINGSLITDLNTATARAAANSATKQIQVSLSAARSTTTVATATNIVLSARYVLRNKKVTA